MSVANAKRDYYDVLGVARSAVPEQIKKAFRRLAHQYHPDRNHDDADAETRFKEASEAYEVLSDPSKRRRYDQFGHAGLSGAGVHDYSHMGVEDIFSMFNDIFDFGLGGGRRRQARGADLQTQIEITLAEVLTGTARTLEFRRRDFCDKCGGSGAAPGSDRKTCSMCGGYGQVEQSGGLAGLFGRVITTCPTCRGAGATISTPCPDCRGAMFVFAERVVTIQVPPGIQDGQVVRLRGEGEPSADGTARGDLHCYVRVKAHPFLERQENNVICRLPITFTQAALGAQIEVPTLTGKAELTIPPGAQHGQVLRLRGEGLPDLRRGKRGDELVEVLIEIPSRLNARQEQLLREFALTEDRSVLPRSKGFFDKLMGYLGGSAEE
jgi:molecular chaperone DnaJ